MAKNSSQLEIYATQSAHHISTDQGDHHSHSDQQKKVPEGDRVVGADPHRADMNRTLPVRRSRSDLVQRDH
jgi:hypothetical protein